MKPRFDAFDKYKQNQMKLCKPNKSVVGFLAQAYDIQLQLRYNDMSELSFSIPQTIDCKKVEVYDKICSKRLVFVEDIGYFTITSVSEVSDGGISIKNVSCYSLECELNYKKVSLLSGTYKLYDIINPETTILYKIFKDIPDWSIGNIDIDLCNKYRTFDVSDSTIYDFLMNEIENAYECVFNFDTITKTINATATKNISKKTDIFLSHTNLIDNLTIDELSDEIVTALNVFGDGELDIRMVNPLGTNTIYNFDYYMTEDWISAELIEALTEWKNLCDINKPQYIKLLNQYKQNNTSLITLQSQLVELKGEYVALENVQKSRIEQGLNYDDIYSQMQSKQNEIVEKEEEILGKQSSINSNLNGLSQINDMLSLKSYLSEELYLELSPLIIQNTYQNSNFLKTSTMTEIEIQDMSQELYEQGVSVLNKVSQPRYTFDLSAVNFIYLKEYQEFIKQLELGCTINIQNSKKQIMKPTLLQISFYLDNPNDFTLTFGNRFRLNDSDFTFSDILQDAISGGTSVNFNSAKWSEWVNSGSSNNVTKFINSALDCSKNNIINAKNQEILISTNGLRGRKYDEELKKYNPKQVWLTSNTIALTKDNWKTTSLAIGEINYNGTSMYGVVGEAIVGKIIAGNQLEIASNDNSFTIDKNGTVLKNSTFTIETNSGKNKITLDPSNGFKIQGRNSTSQDYTDKISLDNNGNAVFYGKITSNSGSIGGWNLSSNGLTSSNGDKILSDGTGKLGMLSWDRNNATFDGNIYARNLDNGGITSNKLGTNAVTTEKVLDYSITDSKIKSLTADKLTAGTIDANVIKVKNINASNITTGILSADRIDTSQLVTKTGVFSGRCEWKDNNKVYGRMFVDDYAMQLESPNTSLVLKSRVSLNLQAGLGITVNGLPLYARTLKYRDHDGQNQSVQIWTTDYWLNYSPV